MEHYLALNVGQIREEIKDKPDNDMLVLRMDITIAPPVVHGVGMAVKTEAEIAKHGFECGNASGNPGNSKLLKKLLEMVEESEGGAHA